MGLNRFDGRAWVRLTHEDGLPATAGFDPDVRPPSGEPCDPLQSPDVGVGAVAPDGTVWLTTLERDPLVLDPGGGDVVAYDGQVLTPFPYPEDQAPETFGGYLRVDEVDGVWLPTFTRQGVDVVGPGENVVEPFTGVARFDASGTWQRFPLPGDPIWPPPGAMPVALAHWDGTAWTLHTERLPDLFGQLVVDPTGTVWAPLTGTGELMSWRGIGPTQRDLWTPRPDRVDPVAILT